MGLDLEKFLEADPNELTVYEARELMKLLTKAEYTFKLNEVEKSDEPERIKTLDELLSEGYSIKEANDYFKNLERKENEL